MPAPPSAPTSMPANDTRHEPSTYAWRPRPVQLAAQLHQSRSALPEARCVGWLASVPAARGSGGGECPDPSIPAMQLLAADPTASSCPLGRPGMLPGYALIHMQTIVVPQVR